MRRVLLIVASLLLPQLVLAAEPRIALVIGNGRYATSPLTNPTNDAQLISETLGTLGFEVISRRNGDQATMKRAIQEFGMRLERAGPNAVGLFFYAGHGVQLNGRNYLIPVNANIERDSDVEIEAVSADWVMEQMRYARNRLNIVILDACRNNPFSRSMRSADRGLAKMDAPTGVMIAYSTAPGDVAADGTSRNSPYSEALAKAMRVPNQPIEQVFKRTRIAVIGATNTRQTPWESSSLTGDFYFSTSPAAAAVAPPAQSPVPVAVAPPPAPIKKPAAATSTVATAPRANTPPVVTTPASRPPTKVAAAPVAAGDDSEREAEEREAPVRSAQTANANGFRNVLGVVTSSAKRIASVTTSTLKPGSAAADKGNFCSLPVGQWTMTGNQVKGEVQVNPDRSLLLWKGANQPAVKGTWSCDAARQRLVVNWAHGGTDTVTMTSRNRVMQGTDQQSYKVVYKKLR